MKNLAPVKFKMPAIHYVFGESNGQFDSATTPILLHRIIRIFRI